MKVTTISYEKCHNLGNYEHEKIRVEAEVHEGDDVFLALKNLRMFVDADIATAEEKRQYEFQLNHGTFSRMRDGEWFAGGEDGRYLVVRKSDDGKEVLLRGKAQLIWMSPMDVQGWYPTVAPDAGQTDEEDEHVTDDDPDYDPDYDPMAEE